MEKFDIKKLSKEEYNIFDEYINLFASVESEVIIQSGLTNDQEIEQIIDQATDILWLKYKYYLVRVIDEERFKDLYLAFLINFRSNVIKQMEDRDYESLAIISNLIEKAKENE